MSLRRRMVVLTALAVALAVLLSAIAAFLAVKGNLESRVDHQLRSMAGTIAAFSHRPLRGNGPPPNFDVRRIPRPGLRSTGEAAVFDATGRIYRSPGDSTDFRLTAHDLSVARGTASAYFRDTHVGSLPVRAYVARVGQARAVIAEQSLADTQSTLHQLALILGVIALAGIALAGVFGLLVARAAARPVHDLRQAAEHVGSTGDLSKRIEIVGKDDIGRLVESFNAMLAALEHSRRIQQQLIGDASHELRTPVASLRTNIEVLTRNPDLHPAERTPLLEDLVTQMIELSALVDDLLESAREEDALYEPERLQLADVVRHEISRCTARHPDVRFKMCLEPCEVEGVEPSLGRAIRNILDNAVKWSPRDELIEVTLSAGELRVRDHGPGFAAEDLPRVFDRFYRSPTARAVPGAGLGLSIVRKIADEHGGSIDAANATGGGALVTLRLPTLPTAEIEPDAVELYAP
jgi:two-component system sensor histidine kinase MprB